MKDIQNKGDVKLLVDAFYKKVLDDQVIGSIFTDTIDFIWEQHIPVMYKFWDAQLFDTALYKGNPMLKHISLNEKVPLTKEKFDRWLKLWEMTIDELFIGPIAEKAKEKAIMIGRLMQHKINNQSGLTFIPSPKADT